jgi:hypothetical protein
MIDSPFAPVIKEAARLLGLEVRQGQEAFELAASAKLFTAADKLGRDAVQKVEGYQEDLKRTRGLLATLNEHLPLEGFLNNHNAAMGNLDGDTIFLLPEIRQNNPTLHMSLMFGHPQDLTLFLFPQKWYHSIGSVFGLQDIQIGDVKLDPMVIVRASDAEKAQLLLSKPDVSRSLIQLYSENSLEPIVNDLSIRSAVTRIPKAEDVVSWIKLMQGVSAALRDAG